MWHAIWHVKSYAKLAAIAGNGTIRNGAASILKMSSCTTFGDFEGDLTCMTPHRCLANHPWSQVRLHFRFKTELARSLTRISVNLGLGPFHADGPIGSACQFFRRTRSDHPLLSMERRMSKDMWHLILSTKNRQMGVHCPSVWRIGWQLDGNRQPIEDSITGVYMDLSSACSVGISGQFPCWAGGFCQCERGLRLNVHRTFYNLSWMI